MTEIAVLIALVYALSAFNYSLGAVFRTLPVPRHEWRAYGPMLSWDATVSLFAISSVSAVQLLMNWLSALLNESFPGPFSSSTASFAIITSQLVLIDTTLILIVTALSATVILSPVAELMSRGVFAPSAFYATNALVLWSLIAVVISVYPRIWLWSYLVGVAFYALPFRLGRRLGAYLMSSSIVIAVALPILPSLALDLQAFIGYEGSLRGLVDLASQIQTNPLAIPTIIASLPQTVATLMAAVIISLILFPIAYLFALSLLVRSVVNLIGGSSLMPTASFFLGPSKQLAKGLAE